MNKAIEIREEDLHFIMAFHLPELERAKQRVCCRGENHKLRQIEGYTAWVNAKGDILLDGYCSTCKHRMTKYIESSRSPEARQRALYIRELKVKLFKNARIRPR